jgi:hypothetical protein
MGNMRFNWRRVLVKEYNTVFVLVLALAVLKLWSEYLTLGQASQPPAGVLAVGFAAWLASYVFVRSLKKTGAVQA